MPALFLNFKSFIFEKSISLHHTHIVNDSNADEFLMLKAGYVNNIHEDYKKHLSV